MNTTQAPVNRNSNHISINSSTNGLQTIQKDQMLEDEEENELENEIEQQDPRNFTIPIYKNWKLRIYKPLIWLKLALFVWYGGGSAVGTFLLVFFKQRGLTLSEISTIYIITPILQFVGPTICGIIADKIGRSKPVLIVNLLLTIVVVGGILAAPDMHLASCKPQPVKLKCHREEFGRLVAKTSCDVPKDRIELASCNVTCPENVTRYCSGQNLICDLLEGNDNSAFNNFSLSVHVNMAYKLNNRCYYNVLHMSHKNATYSWCNVPHKMYCKIQCLLDAEDECSEDNSGRTGVLVLNTFLLISFFTVFSNTYRFLDVTSMILVKEHDSDFGRQRIFAIMGVLVFSPLAGFLIDITTIDDEMQNYDTAFYLFIGMICLMFPILYVLDVKIRAPGKNMWRKALGLCKNFDVVSFVLILIVCGTTWGFMKNFMGWYLEGMDAPSFLLGLINSVSSLYGLPFLMTSNWWVKKIGTTQIFLLGLLGYVASGIGYSFLYNPWLSLLIEVTNIVTYHLFWVAVIIYSHSIAPEGLTATVISAAGGIHYSIGKGAGGLIGGSIMSAFGGRVAYRSMALICLITAVLYAFYLYVRKVCFTENVIIEVRNGTANVECEFDETNKDNYAMRSYKT